MEQIITAESTDGGTAWELIKAVEKYWGVIGVDLAAEASNAKAAEFITPEENALTVNWTERLKGRRGWLNPPFTTEPILPWVHKCVEEYKRGARIILIAPVELSTVWWWESVKRYSAVNVLTPQMTADELPMDLAICTYGLGVAGRMNRFLWGQGMVLE